MSNRTLVKRLRDQAEWLHRVTGASVKRSIYTEAADEIERLTNAAPQASTGNGNAQDRLANAGVPGPAVAAPITQAAGESAVSAVHRGGSTGMESSREGEKPSAEDVQGYMMALK